MSSSQPPLAFLFLNGTLSARLRSKKTDTTKNGDLS